MWQLLQRSLGHQDLTTTAYFIYNKKLEICELSRRKYFLHPLSQKCEPGVVLYADLDNFSGPDMPTVTTSQHPLPPIKKLTPYIKIDYAEIMHSQSGGQYTAGPQCKRKQKMGRKQRGYNAGWLTDCLEGV